MARQMKDSGIEWIGEIPETWAVSKVKYFIDCYDGRRVPVDAGERVPGPYPYWGAGSITDYVDNYLFDEELILLGEDGAPFFDPTRPVAFLVNEKIWVNNHIHVLKPHEDVCPAYLLHFLNTVDYKTYINGSILNKLTQSNMNSIAFIVPPIAEQHRIAAFLDRKCAEIDAVIERTRATIEEYKKLKQAVITEAVTKGVRGPRPMKDSGIEWIGEIPEEWESVKLKYCTYIRARLGWKGLKAEEYVESGYPFLSAFNIINSKLDYTEVNYINQFRYDESPEIKLALDDILLVKDGAGIGKCAIVDYMPIPATPNGSLAVITVTSNLLPKFLYYYFLSKMFQKYIDRIKDGMGVPHLFQSDLREINIVFGDAEEQCAIIAYLDEKCAALDTLITKKTALLTELETHKKSLIYEYVTGKKEVE